MSPPSDSTDQNQCSLAQTLHQTAHCVMQMGHVVLDLEHHILGDDDHSPNPRGGLQGLQALDFLRQTADDLSALLDRLANTVPDDTTISHADVIAPMKLQELRDAIGRTSDTKTPSRHLRSDKEIELF